MTPPDLESPDVEEQIVEARGDDLGGYLWRPPFTGDIFELNLGTQEGPERIALVQHPCAMRSGITLRPTLLACAVRSSDVKQRTKWLNRPFAEFAVEEADGDLSLIFDFDDLLVVSRDEVVGAHRTLVLSELGVNLCVQRWIHYNSRVVIPTITINEQLSPQFDEADLVMEAILGLVQGGMASDRATLQVEEWLSTASGGSDESRRTRLADPQKRSAVRREIRGLLATVP